MNTRRQFLITAPLGVLGAAAACRRAPEPSAGSPPAGVRRGRRARASGGSARAAHPARVACPAESRRNSPADRVPPAALEDSADKVIDQTLERRPDLIAKVAALRGKEAEVRRARAEYFPTLSLVSNVNTIAGRVKVTGGNQPTGWFSAAEPSYGAGLAIQWNIFEGGATQRKVELAEAERRAAEAEVTAARDQAIRDVWKAYTDVRLAVRRLDVAAALVDASEKSYGSTLESYRRGLETLTNLLAARRELSRARFVELDTRVQLLNASAALAFSTGAPQ